jgi:hypothetical protein
MVGLIISLDLYIRYITIAHARKLYQDCTIHLLRVPNTHGYIGQRTRRLTIDLYLLSCGSSLAVGYPLDHHCPKHILVYRFVALSVFRPWPQTYLHMKGARLLVFRYPLHYRCLTHVNNCNCVLYALAAFPSYPLAHV